MNDKEYKKKLKKDGWREPKPNYNPEFWSYE